MIEPAAVVVSPRLERPRWRARIGPHRRELALLALVLITAVSAAILEPRAFPTFGNLSAVLRNLALDGIVACGMTLLFVAGTFDLSVGGTFSMVGVVTGFLMKEAGVPVGAAIAAGLALGAAAGLVNGLVATKLRINPLITTLATMGIYRGIGVLTGGPGISFLPPSFGALAQGRWLGLQTPFWLMLALAAVAHVALARTRFFRQYYYVGGNARAAHLAGIAVERLQILAFVIAGLLAGLAGMTFAARLGTAVSNAGDGLELRVITAVILGGASLQGGRGTIAGALLGVVFMALVNNVLIIGGVSSYWQGIVVGLALVAALGIDAGLGRRKEGAS